MRILLVDNLMIRRWGNLRMGPGRKLACGAVRNDWRICEFSDRDMARLLAPAGIRAIGGMIANRKLVKTAKNFRPDAVILGHCDYITNETLSEIRKALPGAKIAHFNVDPLWQESTAAQMERRMESCDALFATTAGPVLRKWKTARNAVAFMPNPSDTSMECEDNSLKKSFARDVFFAGNPRPSDPRMALVRELRERLAGRCRFDVFAMEGAPQIWGAEYERVLATTKMAPNINRREGDKWYSSDRMAHLMGYGILTFISDKGSYQDFFAPDREAVYYSSAEELADKILFYMDRDPSRAAVAHAGREKYHAIFGGADVLRFMVETMFGDEYSRPYPWRSEVYR